jgi:hypothetical protein
VALDRDGQLDGPQDMLEMGFEPVPHERHGPNGRIDRPRGRVPRALSGGADHDAEPGIADAIPLDVPAPGSEPFEKALVVAHQEQAARAIGEGALPGWVLDIASSHRS